MSAPRSSSATITVTVPLTASGQRLDQALAASLPEYSRSRIQQWMDAGLVWRGTQSCRRRDKAQGGDQIILQPPPPAASHHQAQPLTLDVQFEDDQLIIVNKPAGLVVHPAAGHRDGTLLNALLHHHPPLEAIPRCGLVHRLDKDTSGLLAVAKTLTAHQSLVNQLQQRTMRREYRALVNGVVISGGQIDAPIGRHPVQRKKMAVVASGRPALTEYRVLRSYRAHSLLQVKLHTGRTHQIRVHMAHQRYPLVGDSAYGGRVRLPPNACPELIAALQQFPRQALHAIRLGLSHPISQDALEWSIPMAPDLQALLDQLARDVDERA